jgi:hypothetical protein
MSAIQSSVSGAVWGCNSELTAFGQTDLQCNKKLRHKGQGSVDRYLINLIDLYIIYAPIRDLPATFPYCCPTTVLEWKVGHDIIPPPVVIPASIIFHVPALRL